MCLFCSLSLQTKANLLRHVEEEHPGMGTSGTLAGRLAHIDRTQAVCTVCRLPVGSQTDLEKHIENVHPDKIRSRANL